jgi:hypothetical protein
MARASRGCKGFLHRIGHESRRGRRDSGRLPGAGLAFPRGRRYIICRCRVGRSVGRGGGIIEFPTPAVENRVAPVLFMLTMAVDYL